MGDNSAEPRGTKRGAVTIAASDKHAPRRTNKRQRLRRPPGDETPQLCPECFALDLPKAFAEADTFFDANWDLVLGLRRRSNLIKFTIGLRRGGKPGLRVPVIRIPAIPQEFRHIAKSGLKDCLNNPPSGALKLGSCTRLNLDRFHPYDDDDLTLRWLHPNLQPPLGRKKLDIILKTFPSGATRKPRGL